MYNNIIRLFYYNMKLLHQETNKSVIKLPKEVEVMLIWKMSIYDVYCTDKNPDMTKKEAQENIKYQNEALRQVIEVNFICDGFLDTELLKILIKKAEEVDKSNALSEWNQTHYSTRIISDLWNTIKQFFPSYHKQFIWFLEELSPKKNQLNHLDDNHIQQIQELLTKSQIKPENIVVKKKRGIVKYWIVAVITLILGKAIKDVDLSAISKSFKNIDLWGWLTSKPEIQDDGRWKERKIQIPKQFESMVQLDYFADTTWAVGGMFQSENNKFYIWTNWIKNFYPIRYLTQLIESGKMNWLLPKDIDSLKSPKQKANRLYRDYMEYDEEQLILSYETTKQ